MTKNEYETMICVYHKRRQKYKLTGIKPDAVKLRKLSIKIANWKLQIRRIEYREAIIKNIIESVNIFFDVNIKSRCFDKNHVLARRVFYKFGMENNHLRGSWLAVSIGRKKTRVSADCRMKFTRSFKTNIENREAYRNFIYHQENSKRA